jgi:hypothetical protein
VQPVECRALEKVVQRRQGGAGRGGLSGCRRGCLSGLIGDDLCEGAQQIGLAVECCHPMSYFRVSGMKG